MLNIIKGFIIGIFKITPGVSGSMMAISFGIYDRLIEVISNIFHITLKDFFFLFTFCIGLLGGVIFFSGIINFLLNKFYFSMMFLFMGMIVGGFKDICENILIIRKNIFFMSCIFIIFLLITLFISYNNVFVLKADCSSYFIMGIVEVLASIVPGVSGTAIFMALGCYDFLLDLLFNVLNSKYFIFNLFFMMGMTLSLLLFSKLFNFLFKRYKDFMRLFVFTLSLFSLIMMGYNLFVLKPCFMDIFIGIILFIVGNTVTIYINKLV